MSHAPFTSDFNQSAIPLPDEALRFLTDHCERMMDASMADHQNRPFLGLLADFDFERDIKVPWIPEHMEPFYGTEFHKSLGDEQRLVLNHLGWVAHYHYAVIGELMTLKYNDACADIFAARGYDAISDYLKRESDEEREHAHTFTTIGNSVEDKYLGNPMIQVKLKQNYDLPESGFADFAPWKATSFYYWLRGHQNIALRVREQDMQRVDDASTPLRITTAHFQDETRHYATSHIVAEAMAEMDDGLPHAVRLDWITKRSFNGPQAGANWVWPTVQGTPGNLIFETAQLLSNPLFGLKNKAEVMDVMESLYTKRPDNAKWEKMRKRAIRPTMRLNQKATWLPERLTNQDKVLETMKFNMDKGLIFSKRAFKDFKAVYEADGEKDFLATGPLKMTS